MSGARVTVVAATLLVEVMI